MFTKIDNVFHFQDEKKKEANKIINSLSTKKNTDGKNESVSISNISSPVTKNDKEILNQVASTSGLKMKDTSEPNWGQCNSLLQPVIKPPHLRSKVLFVSGFWKLK